MTFRLRGRHNPRLLGAPHRFWRTKPAPVRGTGTPEAENRGLLAGGAGEVGGSLLAVAGQALGRVGAAEAVELVGQRRVERGRLRSIPVVERVLGPADGALRAAGQRDRHLQGPLVDL